VFSREQLLNHLYDDYRVVTDRTIDSHIKTCAASWKRWTRPVIYSRGVWRRVSLGCVRIA
jgi:DNA-binding response OmpR family regulator